MDTRSIEGVEIPYDLAHIRGIDPELVGHATLFRRAGQPWEVVSHVDGPLRELLVADYERRSPEKFPDIIMYSGCRTA
ncbi:MAG TPA: hypothetical protein VL221_01385 [Bacteroidota bacterium]|nr:hypothetical protein [Bacteroidota bacterium]